MALGGLVSASAFEVVVGGDVRAREFLNVLEFRARAKNRASDRSAT
jgi:hypothetical protein